VCPVLRENAAQVSEKKTSALTERMPLTKMIEVFHIRCFLRVISLMALFRLVDAVSLCPENPSESAFTCSKSKND
jgi:hypothetical protein